MYVCTDWFLIVAGLLLNGAPRVLAEKNIFWAQNTDEIAT